jgi:hypothetical protein
MFDESNTCKSLLYSAGGLDKLSPFQINQILGQDGLFCFVAGF